MKIEIRFYRGNKSNLPKSAEDRRVIVTLDTREIFIGQGEDNPLVQVKDIGQMAELLAGGVIV